MTAVQPAPFHRFGDVAVRLSVELGRTEMPLRDVLQLGEGSTVSLDRLTDELLDVTANGRVIARGEVVADKGRFALRIVSLVGEEGQEVPPPAAPAPSTEAAA
jgi:flagellar motor switch protein FliN/FliY